jgi:hypothetical protein
MSPNITEKELLSRLAELPREISPGRDPWLEISARLESSGTPSSSTRSAPGWLFKAAAASVVLVFTAGLLLKPLWNTGPGASDSLSSHGSVAVRNDDRPAEITRTPGLLDTIDAEYLAAFHEFNNIGGSRGNLAPQTVEKIEMGWADLRVTETALAVALEENPGDVFLNERMLELRTRQLGFLKQLITLDRNNRRMTI